MKSWCLPNFRVQIVPDCILEQLNFQNSPACSLTLLVSASRAFGTHHYRCRANITHIPGYAPLGKNNRRRPCDLAFTHCSLQITFVPFLKSQPDTIPYRRETIKWAKKRALEKIDLLDGLLLVFSVTPFKIDQNQNQNPSIDKVQNLGNKRRYIYKDPRQDSGQRNISYTRYPKKCFAQTYRDLYGDAMLVLPWMSSNMADGNQQKHLLPSFVTKA